MGKHTDPIYALEGSVTVAESTTNWIQNNLFIVDSNKSMEVMSDIMKDKNEIHFVPSLSGFNVPYWKIGTCGYVAF